MQRFMIVFTFDIKSSTPVHPDQIAALMGNATPERRAGEDELSDILWSGPGHLEGEGRVAFSSVEACGETPPAEAAELRARFQQDAADVRALVELDVAVCPRCAGIGKILAFNRAPVDCPRCLGAGSIARKAPAEDLCRVELHNAKGCAGHETLWAVYLGPTPGGHRVAARNHSVGACLNPPDPKAPAWGDVFVATGERGSLRYDLQEGTILERFTPLMDVCPERAGAWASLTAEGVRKAREAFQIDADTPRALSIACPAHGAPRGVPCRGAPLSPSARGRDE